MGFETPWLLGALLVVPVAAIWYWIVQRRASRYAVTYSNLDVLASVVGSRRSWRQHLPAALLLAALAVLCVAVARPTWTVQEPSERATVVLVVDVSGSMRATDVKPSRLAAAQAAMTTFVETVPRQLRVGVVAFSDDAQVVVVPTSDREQLGTGISILTPGLGTAIGDGIARAVELVQSSAKADGEREARPLRDERGNALAAVLLLSDGSQTRGVLTPGQGAELAKRAGVPIFTIALGTDEGEILVGPAGQKQRVPVPPDRETLAAIADYTDGEAFDAESAEALSRVYAGLGSRVGREPAQREVTAAFLAVGAALAAAALLAGALVAPRLP
ncbi:MAG: VWA domain-containing protein [Gaiella sp.]